ncbi:tuberous sclerosis 1 protein [Echria macrotheca]|uniref:Tuberous sclerosis 1 protein n=1 Tax=Echria macrotheca TaxID=438768 RepID=A0AAJ0FFU0_9PEZI|nr:tuberous sclerosis 1 protein [Echria macrotheca]
MTSSGSSKDLLKALHAFVQAPSLPLPPELLAVIRAYLEKHRKIDESATDRLNEELASLYEKNVVRHPEKYASFLAILRELRPAIRTGVRIFEWWNRLLDPVLEYVDREKDLAREVLDHTLDLLTIEENDDPASWNEAGLAPFVDRLLDRWMDIREKQASIKSSFADLKERMVKEALLIFGKKDPKCFMVGLNRFFVKKDYRNNALSLLGDFISSQPPHLHLVLQTPLFVNLIHCLQKDESTSTVNMALLSVIMLLPYMPSSVVSFLPTLFNIYARMVFWDRDSLFAQEHTEFGTESGVKSQEVAWEKCLLDPDHDGSSIHFLPIYFTMLYGLYPLNFVDYIRKPQRYLRHADSSEDIDVQAMEIRDRSERFREQHRLHPNFYNLTIESEKTDFSRWIKSEADGVLTECMALRISNSQAGGAEDVAGGFEAIDPSPLETEDDAEDYPLLNSSVFVDTPSLKETSYASFLPAMSSEASGGGRDSIRSGISRSSLHSGHESQDTKPREVGGDSPTLPPHLVPSPSHPQLQDLIQSNKLYKPGLNPSSGNDSVPSLVLSPQEVAAAESASNSRMQPSRAFTGVGTDETNEAARLYHEGLVLQSDLQFERYIKQQHMTHMGELRRKQIREAATEAETQTLMMANRSLKQRLDEAKRQEVQIKREFDHRRNITQKRENDLSTKLRALREEQKKWNAEGAALKLQLEKALGECERLRKIVEDVEEKRLKSEQDLLAVDINADEIEKFKAEIARLSAVEHEYQGKQQKLASATRAAEATEARAEQWRQELTAREDELQRARKQYEAQIAALSHRLSEALRANPGGQASEVTSVFESALSTSRAKHADLSKRYSALMRKYTVLQSTVLEMQCEMGERSRSDGGGGDGEPGTAVGGHPIAIRNRPHRGFSDPEAFDAVSHNVTSPLGDAVSSSVGSPGQVMTPETGASTSPQMERYFGRGGVQNIRKERKDRKEEKPDKKDKKSGTGLRGIRNFV